MNSELFMKCIYIILINICIFGECDSVRVLLKSYEDEFFETSLSLPTLDGSGINIWTYITVKNREKNEENIELKSVINFKYFDAINIANFNLKILPKFINVSVTKLEVPNNNLRNITVDSLSQIPGVRVLNFNSNQIEKIELRSFGVKVHEVRLNCNMLPGININWFQKPEKLILLYMRNNKISYIRKNLFRRCQELQLLDVTNNQIKRIGNGAFIGSSYFTHLSLQGNQINELQSNLFRNNSFIYTLNIADNRLSYLSQHLLDKINIRRLIMFGNPWQCACYNKIKLWLTEKEVTTALNSVDKMKWSENNPVCISALTFQPTCVEDVDEELYNSYNKSHIEPLQFTGNTCDFAYY